MKSFLNVIGVGSIIIGSALLIASVVWAASVPTPTPAPEPNGSGLKFLPVPHATAFVSIGVGPVQVVLSPTQVVLLAFVVFGLLTAAGVLLLRLEDTRDKF
jgi:hypothetical protein